MTRKYTWLSGNPEPIMEPLARIEGDWPEIWAERAARGGLPPAYSTPMHRHDAACEWTDISLPATGGFGALPMAQCQFGGIRDLRYAVS